MDAVTGERVAKLVRHADRGVENVARAMEVERTELAERGPDQHVGRARVQLARDHGAHHELVGSDQAVQRLRLATFVADRRAHHVDGDHQIGHALEDVERARIVDPAIHQHPTLPPDGPEHARNGGGSGERGVKVAAGKVQLAVAVEVRGRDREGYGQILEALRQGRQEGGHHAVDQDLPGSEPLLQGAANRALARQSPKRRRAQAPQSRSQLGLVGEGGKGVSAHLRTRDPRGQRGAHDRADGGARDRDGPHPQLVQDLDRVDVREASRAAAAEREGDAGPCRSVRRRAVGIGKLTLPGGQASIQVVLPAPKRDEEDFFAAHLVNHVLGGGTFTSRLYRELREERGLTYGASSGIRARDAGATWSASVSTRPENAEVARDLLLTEIERMATEGPTEEELAAAKAFVTGSYAISNLGSSGAVAGVLLGIQDHDLGLDYISRREELIDAVTIEDARRVAARYLGAEPTVITVMPEARG